MNLFTEYDFKSSYNKLDDNIAQELYIPCMRNAVAYNRISGYFSSTVFLVAWSALKDFINNGGRMRVLCSPYLTDEDYKAIDSGIKAKTEEVLFRTLQQDFEQMLAKDGLSSASKLLACMIANGTLEVRIVIVRSGRKKDPFLERLYHDKVGIFVDSEGNTVSFRGTINETFKGLSDNGNIESADVFQSWDGGKDAQRAEDISRGFNRVWNGEYDVLDIYDIPQKAQKYIRDKASDYHWEELLEEVEVIVNKSEKWKPNKANDIIKLKDHQSDALEAWVASGCHAIYEGCTGCGKTVIAISAIRHELDLGKKVLVLVPSKELLSGWYSEIKRILTDIDVNIFLCGDGNTSWKDNGNLALWTSPTGEGKNIVIAIMDTASKQDFIDLVHSGNHLFVVADEVHRMGSPSHRKCFAISYGSALGLSATPKRYGDEEGTKAIIDYFGDILKPPYTLKQALEDGVLTPYFYFPRRVMLTDSEQEEWNELTNKISKRYAVSHSKRKNNTVPDDAFLKYMMIERARILKKAVRKVDVAIDILRENYEYGQKWLVYCEDKNQLNTVLERIRNEDIDAYAYYADMPGDRESTLKYFSENGGVIVSIKCLDEGVDIPSTTHAIILASSKNPREFIQRRGRILRRAEGKNLSFLYDAIVIPNESNALSDKSLTIVTSELSRAIEFGEMSLSSACITDLKVIALKFGIDYKTMKDEGLEDDKE